MISKKALTALFTEANRCSCEEPKYTTHDLWEMAKLIQKDLEILELLKELPFEIYQNGGGDNWNWFIDTKQSFKISEETARKLKRWLKNGN